MDVRNYPFYPQIVVILEKFRIWSDEDEMNNRSPVSSVGSPLLPGSNGAQLALLSGLPGAAYECSLHAPWHIFFFSEGVEELTGFSPRTFTDGTLAWANLVHSEDLPYLDEVVDRAVETGTQFSASYRIKCASGEEKWVLEKGGPITCALTGRATIVGFISDITSSKEAEEKAREVAERLDLAIRVHSIGIFDTNPSTGEVHFNEELERIYGYGHGEFERVLTAWRQHVFPYDLQVIDAAFARTIQARESELSYSYRMTRCDGEVRHIEASSNLFYDSDGKNIRRVGVNIDVTDRKRVERRLAETEAELLHVSRLNSLGAMASSLGHELNQPLQAVVNYISAAANILRSDDVPRIDTALESLNFAAQATHRAGSLIKQLRALAEKGKILPRDVSLTALMESTAPIALHDARSKNIVLIQTIDPEADIAFCDPVLLQQVLFNLLRNSVEAMTGVGGTITMRTFHGSANELVVEINDTGAGFDEDFSQDLFTAFKGSKPDGMGVGLSICRTIVEKSGGKIWAESRKGQTSFFFTLPTGAGISQS